MNDEDYRRDELKVVTKPLASLAYAVIAQWHEDGEPASGKSSIELWKKFFDTAYRCEVHE